jgi:hypothetical protein
LCFLSGAKTSAIAALLALVGDRVTRGTGSTAKSSSGSAVAPSSTSMMWSARARAHSRRRRSAVDDANGGEAGSGARASSTVASLLNLQKLTRGRARPPARILAPAAKAWRQAQQDRARGCSAQPLECIDKLDIDARSYG